MADITSPILRDLFIECIHNGSLPYCSKNSGSRTEVKTFRPLSFLPLIDKVIEGLIRSRLNQFSVKFYIFYSDQ